MDIVSAIKSEKPFRRKDWKVWLGGASVNNKYFINEENENDVILVKDDILADDWEIKAEKKRYWQWKTNDGDQWIRPRVYMDEEGRGTEGSNSFCDWASVKKIKIEDDFIDVEVE